MENLSKEKGITIVVLVVTIILTLILAGATIYTGIQGQENVNDSKLVSELEMVQHATLEQYTKYIATKDSTYLVGNKLTDEQISDIAQELNINLVNIPNTYNNRDYYQLDKASLLQIGIQDTDDEYIVNYISGEVINYTVKYLSDQKPLYIKANSF